MDAGWGVGVGAGDAFESVAGTQRQASVTAPKALGVLCP